MQSTIISNMLGEIRQWCYPREFRISRPRHRALHRENNTVLQSLSKAIRALSIEPGKQSAGAINDDQFISDLSTRLWRLRKCMQQPGSQEPVNGIERGYRHLERLFSQLEHSGVRIVDRTGNFYDPGMALKVVSSEPVDGIGREIIKETITPAVYRGDILIQASQVVVGVPSKSHGESSVDDCPACEFEIAINDSQHAKRIKDTDEIPSKPE